MKENRLGRILAPIVLASTLYLTGCATHTGYLLGIPLVSDPEKREKLVREAEKRELENYQIRRNESSLKSIEGDKGGLNLFLYKPNKN